MKNVLTRKLTTVIFTAIMLFVAVCCGFLAANSVFGAEDEAAFAAGKRPTSTKFELSDDLNGQRMYKGQAFKLTVTVSSDASADSDAMWASFDLQVGPLTQDKTEFDANIASKLRVKTLDIDTGEDDDEEEGGAICATNLYLGGAGYSTIGCSDQLQSTTGTTQSAIRISVYAKGDEIDPTGRGRGLKHASEPVTFEITIEVADDLDDDIIMFGFSTKEIQNSTVYYGYGEEWAASTKYIAHQHSILPTAVSEGFIDIKSTDIVRLISTHGKNTGDDKFTSFDIVSEARKLAAYEKDDNVFKFVVSETAEEVILVPFFSAGISAVVGVSDGSENFVPSESISTNGEFYADLSTKFDRIVLQTTDASGEVSTYYVEIWRAGAYLFDLTVNGENQSFKSTFHPHAFDYEIDLPAADETNVSLTATVFEGMNVNETISVAATSDCTAAETAESGEAFVVTVGENGGLVVLTVKSKDGQVSNDYTVKFNVAKKPVEAPKGDSNTVLYVIIGVLGALVLAGLIVLLIILLKRKKNKEEESEENVQQ